MAIPIVFVSLTAYEGRTYYMGAVEIAVITDQGKYITLILDNVLYNPSSPVNLISSSSYLDHGVYWDHLSN